MAIRSFNSIGGFSVAETPIEIVSNIGNVTPVNLTVSDLSDLGAIGNITITGGSDGQFIKTDGNGNLSFDTYTSNQAAVMPYYIGTGDSFQVANNFQGLYSEPIEIDGELVVDGILIELGTAQNAESSQVYFDNNGTLYGNTGFTFSISSGNLDVPGNINATGDIIPAASNTYSLGSNANRWSNLYLSGNTIYLGNATITESNTGDIVLTNADGGTYTVSGNDAVDSTMIASGTSNVKVASNAGVAFNLAGSNNVTTISTAGVITTSGNVVPLGIKTDNYYYANGDVITFGEPAAGSNTEIQFNNGGNFGASANLTFNDATPLLSVSGAVTATGNVTGANIITTSGDVTFGSGASAGTITVDTGTTTATIFSTNMTDVNIGLNANVTLCGTGKTLTARGNVSADNLQATTLSVDDLYSSRTAVSVGSANTTIDSFDKSTYRSAKYTIKVSDNTGYQALEVLLIHDGTTSIITVYGSLSTTGSDLITLGTSVSGNTILLQASPENSATSVNLLGTYVPD